jgi:hypothetical protein
VKAQFYHQAFLEIQRLPKIGLRSTRYLGF